MSSYPGISDPRCDCGHLFEICDAPNCVLHSSDGGVESGHATEHAGQRQDDARTPWNMAAYQLPEGERYCTCCKRDLTGGALRMLELDQRTDTYHDFSDVPQASSQGWFPFGLTCARKEIKKAKAARSGR